VVGSFSVPLGEDIRNYFAREVTPQVPLAWIDESKRDDKDGEIGIIGYEIPFNRHFYTDTHLASSMPSTTNSQKSPAKSKPCSRRWQAHKGAWASRPHSSIHTTHRRQKTYLATLPDPPYHHDQ